MDGEDLFDDMGSEDIGIPGGEEEEGLAAPSPQHQPGSEVAEQFSVGAPHWIALAVVAFCVWWFGFRGTGSGKTAASSKENIEAMRAKRLEAALQRNAVATADVTSKSTKPEDAVGDGLRRRCLDGETQQSEAQPLQREGGKEQESSQQEGGTQESCQQEGGKNTELPAPADASAETVSKILPAQKQQKDAEQGTTPPISTKQTSQQKSPSSEFLVKVRGTLHGTNSTRTISGLSASATVDKLQELAVTAFGVDPMTKVRLFLHGKELRNLDAELDMLNIGAGSIVQAQFITNAGTSSGSSSIADAKKGGAAPSNMSQQAHAAGGAGTAEPVPAGPAPASALEATVSLRVQGTIGGVISTQTLENLPGTSTIAELQQQVCAAFGIDIGSRARLFYLGRELRDPTALLGVVGFLSGGMVQTMFTESKTQPQKPEVADDEGMQSAADAAEPSLTCEGNICTLSGASGSSSAVPVAAQGIPSASMGPAAAAPAPITPEQAWTAMANLEEHLSRATDPNEEPTVRQAAAVLRQMLMAMIQGDNPAILPFVQVACPDLSYIWGYEPTRERLKVLLQQPAPVPAATAC